MEVEKDYADIISGYISSTIEKGKGLFKRKKKIENTVVHPTFAPGDHPGHVSISKAALIQLVIHCVDEFDSSIKIKKIKIHSDSSGSYRIKLFLLASYKTQLSGKFHELQQYICPEPAGVIHFHDGKGEQAAPGRHRAFLLLL